MDKEFHCGGSPGKPEKVWQLKVPQVVTAKPPYPAELKYEEVECPGCPDCYQKTCDFCGLVHHPDILCREAKMMACKPHEWAYPALLMPAGYVKPIGPLTCQKCGLVDPKESQRVLDMVDNKVELKRE